MSDVLMASVSAAPAESRRCPAFLLAARARLWSAIDESFRRPKLLVAIAIATLVLSTVVTMPLWTGRVPITEDMGGLNLPVRMFYAQCLRGANRSNGCLRFSVGRISPERETTYRITPSRC